MLDRVKLVAQLQHISNRIFYDNSLILEQLDKWWIEISNDEQASQKLKTVQCASWFGAIRTTVAVKSSISAYSIISVDGSQIYPDRHQGTLCYLLNIGFVQLSYGFAYKKVIFDSKPYIFLPEENIPLIHDQEAINCQRQELELQEGINKGGIFKEQFIQIPFLVLFDGALLFNQQEKKEEKKYQMDRYLSLLQQSFAGQIPIASYTSLPRSKDLITIINNYARLSFSDTATIFNELVDTQLVALYLKPFERTTIFISNNVSTRLLPQDFKLCFFYVHCQIEIVRVEIPLWLAKQDGMVDQIATIILDQTNKGFGYPVCLSEAHEQAVVKGPDRDFFYQLITTFSRTYKQQIIASQKSLKKRRINI